MTINRQIKFLSLIFVFVSALCAQAFAQILWLDQTPLPNWNERNRAIPKTEKISLQDIARCRQNIRPATLNVDSQIARNGWTLTEPAQVFGRMTAITAAGGFDGMCRPLKFQTFVFVGGKFAGTLSPAPLNSRTDGALINIRLLSDRLVSADYARYSDTDALCCPHKIETVRFSIGTNSVLKPETKTEKYMENQSGNAENLINTTWHWLGTQTPAEKINAAQPENYTLDFLSDGKVNVRADCNTGSGSYKALAGNLTFSGIVTTLMGCSPGSQDRKFLDGLNSARTFRIQGETMLVDLSAESGTMQFARAPKDTADDLKNTKWRWESTQTPTEKITVSDSENYTVEFLPDGKINVQADCNQGRGSYQSDGKSLQFFSIALTRKACLKGSLDNRFLRGLEAARSYKIEENALLVDLSADSGSMRFTRIL